MNDDPIRVFAGCASGGEDAESCAVLEYTLRSKTSRQVELTWLKLGDTKITSGWNTEGWATPFSGLRWAIPDICHHSGRAIYMDSDVILMADIGELWDQDIPAGCMALVRPPPGKLRTCVMIMDCSAQWPFKLDVLKRHSNPNSLVTGWFKGYMELLAGFDGLWNCLDLKGATGLDDPNLKLIHYSQMAHQPHLPYAQRRLAQQGRQHWYDGETGPHWRPELTEYFGVLLNEASIAGYPPESYDWGLFGGQIDYGKKSWAGRPLKVKVA